MNKVYQLEIVWSDGWEIDDCGLYLSLIAAQQGAQDREKKTKLTWFLEENMYRTIPFDQDERYYRAYKRTVHS